MQGIQELYGRSPVDMAKDVLSDASDMERRRLASINAALLRGDGAEALKDAIAPLYTDAETRLRVNRFARFTNSQAVLRRMVHEMARPVYSVAPTRTITPASEQSVFAAIARESRLNQRMALALRTMIANGDAIIFDRYVASLDRIVTSVMDPSMFSVIPHPDDPTVPAAVIYDRLVSGKTWHVYWDGEIVFQLDEAMNLAPFGLGESPAPKRHGLPRLPFTPLHLGERSTAFFDPSPSEDIVAGDLACRLLLLIGLRVLKSRGTSKIKIEGDFTNVPKDQILDEESPLVAPDGATINPLNDGTDSTQYLNFLRALKEDVAANRGISRARLNRDKAEASDDVGLLEVRAELVQTMLEVEAEHFEVLKVVSTERPEPLTPDAAMTVDFGEWELRADREAELRVFEAEEKLGLASILDQIAAKNPECVTEADQWAEYERNLAAYSRRMVAVRALNIPADGSVREPGQDPAANGAMGPAVRDGKMTKDEAAKMARGGSGREPAPKAARRMMGALRAE